MIRYILAQSGKWLAEEGASKIAGFLVDKFKKWIGGVGSGPAYASMMPDDSLAEQYHQQLARFMLRRYSLNNMAMLAKLGLIDPVTLIYAGIVSQASSKSIAYSVDYLDKLETDDFSYATVPQKIQTLNYILLLAERAGIERVAMSDQRSALS